MLEIVDDGYGSRATVLTSQIPPGKWHDLVGDPTPGDAICDRGAYRSACGRCLGDREHARELRGGQILPVVQLEDDLQLKGNPAQRLEQEAMLSALGDQRRWPRCLVVNRLHQRIESGLSADASAQRGIERVPRVPRHREQIGQIGTKARVTANLLPEAQKT